jgi:hypothetical protein
MRIIVICFLVIFCSSCTLKDQEKQTVPSYFDLNSYFKSEAKRLAKANPQITKSVGVNGQVEQKILKVSNWEKEFESFISADINKASWKGSFKIQKSSNLETYLTENEKIPVKKLEIIYRNDKVYGIRIFITNTNSLYTSKDSLSYYPDSLYQINKTQQIKLMDEKKYIITGKFK